MLLLFLKEWVVVSAPTVLAVVEASLTSATVGLVSLCAGVRELLNSSAVYRALREECAEPILVSGPSDSSESVSVSSLRSCWE